MISTVVERNVKNLLFARDAVEHVAILAKKRKLLGRILSGEKTIESRWYVARRAPWKSIAPNEVIYFKESGDPVVAKALAEKVLFIELTPEVVEDLLEKYGKRICMTSSAYDKLKDKRYCVLIFLKDVKRIPPFEIDKSGFGNMAAWITTKSVTSLRKKNE